ncbi:MAG: dockerin type I repeat-containing protein, partial [Oscillospiraceae bacterium]|nr:dockerin type I repeat-containing protein [Oscillospiraceae bacterium]
TTTKATTTTKPVTTTELGGGLLPGDVDGNGSVTATDVVKLIQAILNKVNLTPECLTNADLNKDGNLSIIDVIKLKNMLN